MKIITERHDYRYGDKDYDTDYINWGFDALEEQQAMAQKMMKFFNRSAKSVLDVGCGIGRYHRVWLKAGYTLTGIDISETFLDSARKYNSQFDDAKYLLCSFDEMSFEREFDVAVWTDPVGLTGRPARNIFNALNPGGQFIYEMWNEHYYKQKFIDGQTWTCEGSKYKLINHRYNASTSTTKHEEIVFDIGNDTVTFRTGFDAKNVNHHCSIQILEAAGFENVRFISYEGSPFDPPDDQTKRFFMIGEKQS